VKDIITGASRGYCFIEYKHSTDAKAAYQVRLEIDYYMASY